MGLSLKLPLRTLVAALTSRVALEGTPVASASPHRVAAWLTCEHVVNLLPVIKGQCDLSAWGLSKPSRESERGRARGRGREGDREIGR